MSTKTQTINSNKFIVVQTTEEIDMAEETHDDSSNQSWTKLERIAIEPGEGSTSVQPLIGTWPGAPQGANAVVYENGQTIIWSWSPPIAIPTGAKLILTNQAAVNASGSFPPSTVSIIMQGKP